MAQITLYGNLGADGQLFQMSRGGTALKLRVAEHNRKGNGEPSGDAPEGEEEETQWWTVLVWQPLASTIAPQMQRGVRVRVDGRFSQRAWTDAEGAQRIDNTVLADAVGFWSRRKRDAEEEPPQAAQEAPGYAAAPQAGQLGGYDRGPHQAPAQTPVGGLQDDDDPFADQ